MLSGWNGYILSILDSSKFWNSLRTMVLQNRNLRYQLLKMHYFIGSLLSPWQAFAHFILVITLWSGYYFVYSFFSLLTSPLLSFSFSLSLSTSGTQHWINCNPWFRAHCHCSRHSPLSFIFYSLIYILNSKTNLPMNLPLNPTTGTWTIAYIHLYAPPIQSLSRMLYFLFFFSTVCLDTLLLSFSYFGAL